MADGARTKSEWERLVEEACSGLSQAVSDLGQHLQDLVSLPDRISRQRLLVGLTTREGKQDREAVETLRRLERAEAEAASRSSALRSAVTAALGRVRALAGEVASALDSAEGTYTRLARGLKGRAYQWELESARRAWDGERQFFLGLQSRLRSAETGACQRGGGGGEAVRVDGGSHARQRHQTARRHHPGTVRGRPRGPCRREIHARGIAKGVRVSAPLDRGWHRRKAAVTPRAAQHERDHHSECGPIGAAGPGGQQVRGDSGITAEDRLRVALANLRSAGFSDDVFLQLEDALTSGHEAVGTPRESFGRLTLDAARSEKQVLAAALVPEAGRGLFGRDNEDRFWAVGRIDIGAGPWPRLGILFPADYPETCPLVFVFATSGAPCGCRSISRGRGTREVAAGWCFSRR